MIAMVNEIVGQVRHIIRGITVDEEHLSVDVVEEVDPGGNFLATRHTMKHFKEEVWYPTLMDRQNIDKWKETGEKTMGDRIKEKVDHILSTHERKPLSEEAMASIASVTVNLG